MNVEAVKEMVAVLGGRLVRSGRWESHDAHLEGDVSGRGAS